LSFGDFITLVVVVVEVVEAAAGVRGRRETREPWMRERLRGEGGETVN
jgi:hypothetical protein